MQFLGHSSEAGCSARLVRQKSARIRNLTSVEQATPPRRRAGHSGVPNDLRQILDSRRAENRKRMASAASASTFSPGTCKAWLYRSDADRRNRWSCHRGA